MADNQTGTPPAGDPPATPPGTPPAAPPATSSFMESIPTEYRDKPWAKENASSPDSFFKWVDNQNALIGKKGIVLPAENAKEEEVAAFYDALGRPKDPLGYELSPIEELKDVQRDKEIEKSIRSLFHSSGVPKNMATKLFQGFEKMMFERSKAEIERVKQEDAAYEEHIAKTFGEKKDEIVANAQKVLRADLPEVLKPALDKLDANGLSVLIAITDSLYAKYGKEDSFRGGNGSNSATGESFEELSAAQRELMKDPAFTDWRHPNHLTVQAKNKEIMSKMRLLRP